AGADAQGGAVESVDGAFGRRSPFWCAGQRWHNGVNAAAENGFRTCARGPDRSSATALWLRRYLAKPYRSAGSPWLLERVVDTVVSGTGLQTTTQPGQQF